MEKEPRNIAQIQLLKRYRKIFRIPENLDHYSKEDFRMAERKFIRWSLFGENSNSKTLNYRYS